MFWIICAALAGVVAFAIAAPLMRRERGEAEPAAAFDLRIYRDQLREVERDLERGLIDASDAERLRQADFNQLTASEYRLGVMIGAPWLDRSPVARRGAIGRAYILEQLAAFIARRRADRDPPPDFMTRLLDAFGQDRNHGDDQSDGKAGPEQERREVGVVEQASIHGRAPLVPST